MNTTTQKPDDGAELREMSGADLLREVGYPISHKAKVAAEAEILRRLDACGPLERELSKAISAGEYVVRLVEDTGGCAKDPSPRLKADWLGTTMHCYAAMNYLCSARSALAQAKGE